MYSSILLTIYAGFIQKVHKEGKELSHVPFTKNDVFVFVNPMQWRSFNFDAWRKRFVDWVDQHKVRVRDSFQRFDNNHDGMLTRKEFVKGLKASGKAWCLLQSVFLGRLFRWAKHVQ